MVCRKFRQISELNAERWGFQSRQMLFVIPPSLCPRLMIKERKADQITVAVFESLLCAVLSSRWVVRCSFPRLGSEVPMGGSQTVAGVPLYRLPFEIYCGIVSLLPCAGIHRHAVKSDACKTPKTDSAEARRSFRAD